MFEPARNAALFVLLSTLSLWAGHTRASNPVPPPKDFTPHCSLDTFLQEVNRVELEPHQWDALAKVRAVGVDGEEYSASQWTQRNDLLIEAGLSGSRGVAVRNSGYGERYFVDALRAKPQRVRLLQAQDVEKASNSILFQAIAEAQLKDLESQLEAMVEANSNRLDKVADGADSLFPFLGVPQASFNWALDSYRNWRFDRFKNNIEKVRRKAGFSHEFEPALVERFLAKIKQTLSQLRGSTAKLKNSELPEAGAQTYFVDHNGEIFFSRKAHDFDNEELLLFESTLPNGKKETHIITEAGKFRYDVAPGEDTKDFVFTPKYGFGARNHEGLTELAKAEMGERFTRARAAQFDLKQPTFLECTKILRSGAPTIKNYVKQYAMSDPTVLILALAISESMAKAKKEAGMENHNYRMDNPAGQASVAAELSTAFSKELLEAPANALAMGAPLPFSTATRTLTPAAQLGWRLAGQTASQIGQATGRYASFMGANSLNGEPIIDNPGERTYNGLVADIAAIPWFLGAAWTMDLAVSNLTSFLMNRCRTSTGHWRGLSKSFLPTYLTRVAIKGGALGLYFVARNYTFDGQI